MNIMNAKFYIKAVGGSFTITHRLTHSFIESVETEKDLVKAMRNWVEMPEKELWDFLFKNRHPQMPKQNESRFFSQKREKDDAEVSFRDAWSIYTKTFYSKYKKLFVEQPDFPWSEINEYKREEYTRQKEAEKEMIKEREELEQRYQEDMKAERESNRPQKIEVEDGSLGNSVAIDRARRKERKGLKKVKVKAKSGKVIVFSESENLFA